MKKFYIVTVMCVVLGCSGLVIDRSPGAVASGDLTLALSACEAVPAGGLDACFVRAGTRIESSWKLIVPSKGRGILGGEVDVYYKDVHRSYAIPSSGNIIEIPWKEFFKADVWETDMDGEALAHVTIRFMTTEGIEEIVKFRGMAKLIVTNPGYDRLPIDSGFVAWKTNCEIHYSTAGRGALRCK